MNYIISQINKRIDFLKSDGQSSQLRVHYQAKFEFTLVFTLSYLWNKNFERIDQDEKEYVINCILKPSIGTIVSILRKLDVDNELFGNKALKQLVKFIDDYPRFRNETIGHGFSFEDDISRFLEFFENFFEEIETTEVSPIFSVCNLVKVNREDESSFRGITYKPDGLTYIAWTCHKDVFEFNVGDLYILLRDNKYIRLSPFIYLENESEFYSFCSIEEKLTGRASFNRLLKTGQLSKEVNEFERMSILTDNIKRKSANGTVINTFTNNFKRYVDVGLTKRVIDFLEKNRSSVFATIWGHGGVGKTASIQRVCEILCNQNKKIFDYVIFLSAKDRYYNFYQGRITAITDGISTLEDIVSKVNLVIFNDADLDVESIKGYTGKLLIIIDDFETFSKEQKSRVTSFIKELDINHHKVILTTRAATLITGEEIETRELNEVQTIGFLKQAITNEMPDFPIDRFNKDFKNKDTQSKIFKITSGRPLFILQFGIYLAQVGTVEEALDKEIKSTNEAINFLYDRIYDYLSVDAKNMFLAISLLVDENDLSALINNLKFVLSKEDKEDEFNDSLNELIKLKIVTMDGRDFFKVYSPDIFKLMQTYYQKKGGEYDGNITNRYNLISSGKNASTELALLENADASRLIESEVEVENKYRYILNRDKTPYDVKRKGLLNFANYLISSKAKFQKALKLYQDYFQIFRRDPLYIESYASSAWAESSIESRYLAIQTIQDFLTLKPRLTQESYLSLLGQLNTYKSILLVAEREEIKTKLRLHEITKSVYKSLYKEQKDRFAEIFQYPGTHLFRAVKDIDLMSLAPGCRNLVLDGLTHFVEISIRNGRRDVGKAVCEKVLSETPQSYHAPFVYKWNKINLIEGGNAGDAESIFSGQVSEFGEKLQKAVGVGANRGAISDTKQ